MYVPELQRGRLLSATFAVVGELGYEGVSARRVSERAGASNRTFYEAFSDRQDEGREQDPHGRDRDRQLLGCGRFSP
jgi:AcrR family transcriptional regulator